MSSVQINMIQIKSEPGLRYCRRDGTAERQAGVCKNQGCAIGL